MTETMTVWRQNAYGSADGVHPETVPVPVPSRGQVLLRTDAVSLNSGDIHLMRGEPRMVRAFVGRRGPRVRGRGMDVAGTVAAVGADVEGWTVGDAAVGAWRETLADHVLVPAARLIPLSAGVDPVVAATLPVAGNTALDALRIARVSSGSRVLVVGAGGGVGTAVVQLAADRGAEVWATCGARAQPVLERLGASRTFDYRVTDLAALPPASFDAIVDIAGEPPLTVLHDLLAPRGTVALVGGDGHEVFGPFGRMLRSTVTRGRFRPVASVVRSRTTAELVSLAAAGRLTPHIERVFALSDARAALAHVESGRTIGKVVVVRDELLPG
ncbi:NAD(P)-dependent alcohol dehydrogenase [Microbacterium sp. EYE_5]|uniref:NAD(P)-dependent alcohol dehydrogenase n=1 Tax=unclassified Microbacterium TaxID=2609290 RepID=UPI0020046E49|nr:MULTISPECIES: NAD(P)-dependent alcohol dehydrogenase [unclassified Microbacterium]MCK6081259.1 NAD(P)-dependent alcohol dehydrogenase [Microbacterium sp. EYE_382]MCK6086529.1 NAD(P)-dependent alcohol dehydrogenase [Microbacterium sp. EYE_384]MCK6123973.1 NAD(P)-dependent alcohol dehydrogenase [Microbacterium sp. EYE_80]MCK6126882.1 NAD(P)-dependent alcohol dehydrogenase [Microbacterium sp. EYE_79]MCK6142214.1 NAD(P)-dependent alcohol dehydrogenase [Microbacterium sp. EYE_39]